MDDMVGPLIIERVWTTTDREPAYRIRWTAAQLRRIGQAVRDGDQAFLARIERAMRRSPGGGADPAAGLRGSGTDGSREAAARVRAPAGGHRGERLTWHV